MLSLQLKSVQTFVARQAARYLSNELSTVVEVKGLYVKPFKSLVLEGFYVADRDKDTLLFSPELTVDINTFSLKERKIDIATASLEGGKFYLKSYKKGGTNLKFIIDYFKSPSPSTKKKRKFDIKIGKVELSNLSFKYRNYSKDNALKRINFNDIDLGGLSATVLDINTTSHLFSGQVNRLKFHEKSGFKVLNLSTFATIDTNKMEFKQLYLKTPRSTVRNYLLMRYPKFSSFKHFISEVYVVASLKSSTLHSQDISFFTDATKKINLNVKLSGKLRGYVNAIKARNFFASVGQASYVKGNFNINGLPKIAKTSLNLHFDRLQTNEQDIRFLSKAIGEAPPKLPQQVSKLGTVSLNGNFKGTVKDFRVNSNIKTALGLVNADLHLNLLSRATYSGKIGVRDFNLKELLNRDDLGRTTLTAIVSGQGFEVKTLEEQVLARAEYFDFRGYRYSNIDINGVYNQHLFKGKANINDHNLKLDFNGAINLDLKVPEFRFVATVRNANLYKLGFTKDSISIDGDLNTNFTGNNINNIQGNFAIRKVKITRPSNAFVVDSIDLIAHGSATSRSLKIQSDILDAELKGEYSLKELPDYFKSVVKKYIPSLQISPPSISPQIFSIQLKLKYFEPIASLFLPDLKIPEGASFNGQFNSINNEASVNGTSSWIEYKGFKITNFILDESTSEQSLNIFSTADRIDLPNKVYIENVNMANILKKDSLALNIKLSDKDANNQLDLNGLVEFAADSSAKLSVLPSDVVINKESWRIQDKVRLKFDHQKVFIDGFELSRDNQIVTVDGVISKDPKDVLNVGFQQFKLASFNSLVEHSKINLGGMMNGKLTINTPTSKPKIESDVRIDSLSMNNIPIGDLTLTANMDNETKVVDIEINILKQGVETMFVSGTYNANAETNKLDLDLVMNNCEAILFQPFIKNLVSNLKGSLSSQLKITGSPANPQINGNARLNQVGLTVNYLKTPYHINDQVRIENSVILLNNLEIKDDWGNNGIANGSVNMANPRIPVINVSIDANKILALNTTAKDNPLYYGTAFGTGTFTFRGPTNNMRIDIDAKTEQGTVFNIPLNGSERIGNSNFISYVSKDSTITAPKSSFNNLVMNFELNIDESALVNIFTDVGKLSGRGTSDLSMKITSVGDFEMRGQYQISSGKFVFSVQNYLPKQFDITQGGTIRWTGDPVKAQINLAAKYTTSTNIKDLYVAANKPNAAPAQQRVATEAIINLQGLLTQPRISVDLNFPNDTYIKDDLASYLNNIDNLYTQTMSVIARQAFTANTNLQNAVSQTLTSTGYEMTASILTSVLNQALGLKTVDFNLRSLNDFGVTWRFFNDRLRLAGGLSDLRANNTDLSNLSVLSGNNSYARDVEAQFLIKKDGTLIARAANRLSSGQGILSYALGQEYVNSLGLVYRKDFETFGEFLRALIWQQRKEEKEQSKQPSKNSSPKAPSIPTPSPEKNNATAPSAQAKGNNRKKNL